MGAHSRPNGRQPGKHRGEAASFIDIDARRVAALAGVVAVAAGTAVALAPAAGAATADDFARLRACESGGNYAINTGNGYYGAYQFNLATWRGLGLAGLPNQAPPAVQDQAAATLQSQRGWQPWPGCSRKLGLGSTPAASAPVVAAAATAPVVIRTAATTTVAAPAFDGVVLSAALVGQRRADVTAWQTQMRARGWHLSVDGHFGAQSARTAAAFAAEKHIASGLGGSVDGPMWIAAWVSPVT